LEDNSFLNFSSFIIPRLEEATESLAEAVQVLRIETREKSIEEQEREREERREKEREERREKEREERRERAEERKRERDLERAERKRNKERPDMQIYR
jgi:hypothetical protein